MPTQPLFTTSRKTKTLIAVFVIVVTLGTVYVSATAQPKYATSLSITVNRINTQDTAEYQYDGYYAIQASDLFSQTLLSWFLTPSVLLEIYDRAGVDPQYESYNELVGRFRARKFAAQNIVVEFSEPSADTAEKLAVAIGDVMKERGEDLNRTANNEALFEVEAAQPAIVETTPNVTLNTIVAFISSLLIALAFVAVVRYMRTEQHEDWR